MSDRCRWKSNGIFYLHILALDAQNRRRRWRRLKRVKAPHPTPLHPTPWISSTVKGTEMNRFTASAGSCAELPTGQHVRRPSTLILNPLSVSLCYLCTCFLLSRFRNYFYFFLFIKFAVWVFVELPGVQLKEDVPIQVLLPKQKSLQRKMHLHFEEPSSQLRCDSVINSLSWMGRVPDEQPEVSVTRLINWFLVDLRAETAG